jgi:hypothetical protein
LKQEKKKAIKWRLVKFLQARSSSDTSGTHISITLPAGGRKTLLAHLGRLAEADLIYGQSSCENQKSIRKKTGSFPILETNRNDFGPNDDEVSASMGKFQTKCSSCGHGALPVKKRYKSFLVKSGTSEDHRCDINKIFGVKVAGGILPFQLRISFCQKSI